MNASVEQRLNDIVRQLEPDMVNFCSRLLQIPSVNGWHDEVHLAEAVASQAQQLGLHTQIVGDNPRRPNVIVSTMPQGKTGLLLLGHLDTVPPGDEQRWTYPPFSGTITQERIYGRGAVDTKGGMTAALYALAALARVDGALHTGRAQLICVPDEESGATGTLGIKYLTAQGLLNGAGAVYAYSGHEITLGHRGLIRYRLVCRGETIHTGALEWQNQTSGANAITGMARLLLALEHVETNFSTRKYFERFKTVITPGTVINGGVSINVVPDSCEALVDIRLTPEYDLATVEALLQNCIQQITQQNTRLRFHYDLLNHVPAVISDETAPIFSILETVIEQIKAHKPPRVVAGPANEGYLLIEQGIPTVCGLGPTGENAHSVDEYVEIQGLVEAAVIFCLTAHHLSKHIST